MANLNRLSFYSAIAVSMSVVGILFALTIIRILSISYVLIFIIYPILFLSTFFIVRYYSFGFIQGRLKIIYKLINKSNPSQINFGERKDTFETAERDVEEWIKKKNEEQSDLMLLEEYRREYIGNVAHELKTPIFNIQGYLQTLIHGGINDDEVNVKFLNKALSNAERLQNIVDDLSAISRLESGESDVEVIDFDIKILCQEVFEEFQQAASEKAIRLIYKSELEYPLFVHADKEQIRLVLTNLVQNAIRYGIKNGFVKIRTYDIDSRVLIEVADNGIGIPADSLPKVFDRFYRVDKGRSREMGGSGLGLSIVKHILERHKSSINVRSQVGEGTVFSFTLESSRMP